VPPRRFPMSLDASQRALTTLVIVVLAVALVVLPAVRVGGVAWIGLPAAIAAGLLAAWALAPTAVEVDAAAVRIVRRAWRPFVIPLHEIQGVEPTQPLGRRLFRLVGVGGFFGSYGLFWRRDVGRFRAYLTRSAAALLLRRRGALPVMITPDDPAAVGAALAALGVHAAVG